MATIEALQPRLRQLKLSGMVDSIAARVQEARARPLDPLDFLLLLLEDELMRRESESIDRYIHRAHFDEVCDLRDFDFAYNPVESQLVCPPSSIRVTAPGWVGE